MHLVIMHDLLQHWVTTTTTTVYCFHSALYCHPMTRASETGKHHTTKPSSPFRSQINDITSYHWSARRNPSQDKVLPHPFLSTFLQAQAPTLQAHVLHFSAWPPTHGCQWRMPVYAIPPLDLPSSTPSLAGNSAHTPTSLSSSSKFTGVIPL